MSFKPHFIGEIRMHAGDFCSSLPAWTHPLVWVGIMTWEFYLGKTKFGSTIQLLGTSLVAVWAAAKQKDKK